MGVKVGVVALIIEKSSSIKILKVWSRKTKFWTSEKLTSIIKKCPRRNIDRKLPDFWKIRLDLKKCRRGPKIFGRDREKASPRSKQNMTFNHLYPPYLGPQSNIWCLTSLSQKSLKTSTLAHIPLQLAFVIINHWFIPSNHAHTLKNTITSKNVILSFRPLSKKSLTPTPPNQHLVNL